MAKYKTLLDELDCHYKDKYYYFIETINQFDILSFSNNNPYNDLTNDYVFIYIQESNNSLNSYNVSLNSLTHPHTSPNDNGYINGIRLKFRDFLWLLKRKNGIDYIQWFENLYNLHNNKHFKAHNRNLCQLYNTKLKEYLINKFGFDILNAIEIATL